MFSSVVPTVWVDKQKKNVDFKFVIIATVFIVSTSADCKPVSVQDNFNVTEYVRARWYIHQQMAVKYLPENQNYCVFAE